MPRGNYKFKLKLPPGLAAVARLLRAACRGVNAPVVFLCLLFLRRGCHAACRVPCKCSFTPIAAEPQSVQGGTMEQSSTWAKICHFSEVGHWSRSFAAFFFRKFLSETHFCGANCVALLQCELRLRQLHLHKIHKSTDNLNWCLRAYELSSSHLHPELSTDALHKLCFAM